MSMKLNKEHLRQFIKSVILEELATGGVSPYPIGKAYLNRSEIKQIIISRLLELSPHGTPSVQEFEVLLDKVLNEVSKTLFNQNKNIEVQSDIVLTINDIQRELLSSPLESIYVIEPGSNI